MVHLVKENTSTLTQNEGRERSALIEFAPAPQLFSTLSLWTKSILRTIVSIESKTLPVVALAVANMPVPVVRSRRGEREGEER